jgi:hypothetical protein
LLYGVIFMTNYLLLFRVYVLGGIRIDILKKKLLVLIVTFPREIIKIARFLCHAMARNIKGQLNCLLFTSPWHPNSAKPFQG